jgi:glyoxylase-like metal-dependent hydrolase (beta-lactamase superfamily II)
MAEFVEEIDQGGQMVHLKEDREIVPGVKMVHTPAHTKGGMTILVETEKGTAAISGFCVIMENFFPPQSILAMEMEAIPPGTNINPYLAYDQILRVKKMADIIIPLHEPMFASVETIPDDLKN